MKKKNMLSEEEFRKSVKKFLKYQEEHKNDEWLTDEEKEFLRTNLFSIKRGYNG